MDIEHVDIIVSRHAATIQYLLERWPSARVLEHAEPADVLGRVVAGNLPLQLAQYCAAIVAVEFTGAPPRGQELTADDLVAAGVRLRAYVVHGPDVQIAPSDESAFLTGRAAVHGIISMSDRALT